MRLADLSDLRGRIAELVKESTVGGQVEHVEVEAADDEAGADFLRVIVQLKGLEEISIEDVEPLAQSIEDLVSQVDERFASVRFAEAA